jgi:WD40 repeat protein
LSRPSVDVKCTSPSFPCSHKLILCTTSGYAALSHNARYLIVSNMNIGMNLYALGEKEPLQSFLQPTNTGINFPLGVSFLHRGRAVICGSQTGSVKIWDTLTGEHLQTLEHKGPCAIFHQWYSAVNFDLSRCRHAASICVYIIHFYMSEFDILLTDLSR